MVGSHKVVKKRFGVLNGALFNEIRFPGRLVEDADGKKNEIRSVNKQDFDGSFSSLYFEPDDIISTTFGGLSKKRRIRDEDGLLESESIQKCGFLVNVPTLVCSVGLVRGADGVLSLKESGDGPTTWKNAMLHSAGDVVSTDDLPSPDGIMTKFVNTSSGLIVIPPTIPLQRRVEFPFVASWRIELSDRSALGVSTNADGPRIFNSSLFDDPTRFSIGAYSVSDGGSSTGVYQVNVALYLMWINESELEEV